MSKQRKPVSGRAGLEDPSLDEKPPFEEWSEVLLDDSLFDELLQTEEDDLEGDAEPEVGLGDSLETLETGERERAESTVGSLRQEALAIPKAEVMPFNWNAILIKQNVDRAFALMEDFLPQVKHLAPELSYVRGTRIRETALALVYTSAVAARSTAPGTPTFREGMTQIYKLRRLFMHSALALAEKKKVNKKALEQIQKGTGPVDAIDDAVALASFFRRSPEHLAKSAIDESDLNATFALARDLYPQVKVKGARKLPLRLPDPIDEHVDLRNRMWTLLSDDWDHFWILATLHFKADVAEVIPKLKSHARVRRAASPDASELADELDALEEGESMSEDELGEEEAL